MRVDDARWAVEAFHQPADPHWHLEFAVTVGTVKFRRREDRTACAAACVYKLGWMCTVYCSFSHLYTGALRMALNQTHQRGSKAAKFMTSE